ncbi:hypothetical protein KAI46_09870 [bacterium]|nr:hypothetical protein [bacterium]
MAAEVFHGPARLSLIPALVNYGKLVRANSVILASKQIVIAISYTVGGWLILAVPLREIALVVVALFMLVAVIAMLIVEPKRQAAEGGEKETFWFSFISGWNYLRHHPIARPLTIM